MDYWSLGVLLFEMICGFGPFHGCDERSLFASINFDDVFYPKSMSLNSKILIEKLLERDPSKRLGSDKIEDIRVQVFFQPLDWSKLENGQIEPPFIPKVVCSILYLT